MDHEVSSEQLEKIGPRGRPASAMRREILAGEEVWMPEPGVAHGRHVDRLNAVLGRVVGGLARVSVASVLDFDGCSEVRPDVALLSVDDDPLLVVEVADTGTLLSFDRGRKASFYSRFGVAECWVLDIPSEQLLVHRTPASGGYRDIRNLRADASVTIEKVDTKPFAVSELFSS